MEQDQNEWQVVGHVHEFSQGKPVEVTCRSIDIIVLNQNNRWFAFESLCPHMSRPLSTSKIDNHTIECKWHNMIFSLKDGSIVEDSGFFDIPDLKVFPVKVCDDKVHVKL